MRSHSAAATRQNVSDCRRAGQIELIKTLIEHEGTIGYEAWRNGTKLEPISCCLGTENYFSLRLTMGVISKNCSNDWRRQVRVDCWAKTGFLQAHGRPSSLQRRFHRLMLTGLGSICERCSFGFKRTRRELALPTFVGWRGFLDAMIRPQLANGRWSLARPNRGYRPKDENGREPEAALHRRFQIRH